jgi:hypothetical protein
MQIRVKDHVEQALTKNAHPGYTNPNPLSETVHPFVQKAFKQMCNFPMQMKKIAISKCENLAGFYDNEIHCTFNDTRTSVWNMLLLIEKNEGVYWPAGTADKAIVAYLRGKEGKKLLKSLGLA